MQMTNEEIVRNYKEAKHKDNQIKILAQLNCCDPQKIKDILKDAGVIRKYVRRDPEPKEESVEAVPVKAAKKAALPELLPEAVMDAIRRRMAELDELIKNTQQVLDKNIAQMAELEKYLKEHGVFIQ